MGFYLDVPAVQGKADQLVAYYGAQVVERPGSLAELPPDKALVCVVSNPGHDAAALVYSDRELERFSRPDITEGIEMVTSFDDFHRWTRRLRKAGVPQRRRAWLLMDKETAHKLADYEEVSNG